MTLLDTFSPQTQAELRPYFMPPSMAGSWVELDAQDVRDLPSIDTRTSGPYALDAAGAGEPVTARRIQWHTVHAAGGKVKVWAQLQHAGDTAKANAIAAEITSTIWKELVPVLGAPKPDAGDPFSSGGPELDIFLVRPDSATAVRLAERPGIWDGLAMYTAPPKCKDAGFFLLVDSRHPLGSATSKGLLQIVAHEMAHAMTGAKPMKGTCREYDWMNEATATWAEHKAYPAAQTEHAWAPSFLDAPDVTLDQSTAGEEANSHAYESYLFPLYLQLTGNEAAITAIWKAFAGNDLRPGINVGLGGKLDEVFPQFAVRNINEDPVDEYKKKDRLAPAARFANQFDISIPTTKADVEQPIALSINDLAAHYAKFEFDATVKSVAFDNTLVPLGYAGVWALPRINGSWQTPIDLTNTHDKMWCRDNPLEDISALILVFTNNKWQDPASVVATGPLYEPIVRAYPDPCGRGWAGTSTTTITTTGSVHVVERTSANIRLEVDSATLVTGRPPEHWRSISGNVNWSARVTGECVGSKSGSVSIFKVDPSVEDPFAVVHIWAEGDRKHHTASSGWPSTTLQYPTYTVKCGDLDQIMTPKVLLFFLRSDPDNDKVALDGKSFRGAYTLQLGGGTTASFRYSFRCNWRC